MNTGFENFLFNKINSCLARTQDLRKKKSIYNDNMIETGICKTKLIIKLETKFIN